MPSGKGTPRRDMRFFPLLVPLLAILLTFVLTAPLILAARASPLDAYYSFLVQPLTTRTTALEILVKSTPLLLTGTAVAFAFSAGYYNIGAEGQLYAGALMAAFLGPQMANVPAPLAISILLLGGFGAGMVWALAPALLKTRLDVDEVVTTLLLNTVMLLIVSAILNGPWRNPVTQWPQSPNISASAEFPILIDRSRVHFGLIVAVLAIVALGVVLRYTGLGLQMRAVGQGRDAARFLGIDVQRTTLMAALVSGGIAGLAGVSEIGGIHHHLIDAISPGYGYSGIVVATLGELSAIGVGLAALFVGLIVTGAQEVSRALGVPSYLSDVVQATLLITMLVMLFFNRRRMERST